LNSRTQGVKREAAAISSVELYAYLTGVLALSKLDWPEHHIVSPNSTLARVTVAGPRVTVMFKGPTSEEVGGRVTLHRELASEGWEVRLAPAKVTVTTEPVGALPQMLLGVSLLSTMSSPNTVETRVAGRGAGAPTVRQYPLAVSTTAFVAASTFHVRESEPQAWSSRWVALVEARAAHREAFHCRVFVPGVGRVKVVSSMCTGPAPSHS
jgi:hypothetical protein